MFIEQPEIPSEAAPEEEIPEQPASPELQNLVFENSLAVSVTAGRDANIENSLAAAMVAGNDLTAVNSVGSTIVAGRDIKIQDGGGVLMVVGNEAQLERSTVGILFAGSAVNLTQGSKVLMTSRQALALGAALGTTFALLTAFLRRLRH